MPARLRLHTFG